MNARSIINPWKLTTAAALLVATAAQAGTPVPSTAFTYVGELRNGANPASGSHDVRFSLWSSQAGGAQIGPTLCTDDLQIEGGRVIQTLDFGQAFVGEKRFLQIEVRPDAAHALACGDASGFVSVGPRTQIDAHPVAQFAPRAVSAADAAHAASAVSADDAQRLGGLLPAQVLDAGALTGALPSTALGGTISNQVSLTNNFNVFKGNGAGLTNVVASFATNAATAEHATSAVNATGAAGQPASYYLDIENLTGTFPASLMNGTFPSAVTLNNPSNVFQGQGTSITGLNCANLTSGTIPASMLAGGIYDRVLAFGGSASQYTFAGNGYGVSINPANFTQGTVPPGRLPAIDKATGNLRSNVGTFSQGNSPFVTVPNSSGTISVPLAGTCVLQWSLTGYSTLDNTNFQVRVYVDGVAQGIAVPFDINHPNEYQSASGNVVFPITAGSHTVDLRVSRSGPFGSGVFTCDTACNVSWSTFVAR